MGRIPFPGTALGHTKVLSADGAGLTCGRCDTTTTSWVVLDLEDAKLYLGYLEAAGDDLYNIGLEKNYYEIMLLIFQERFSGEFD